MCLLLISTVPFQPANIFCGIIFCFMGKATRRERRIVLAYKTFYRIHAIFEAACQFVHFGQHPLIIVGKRGCCFPFGDMVQDQPRETQKDSWYDNEGNCCVFHGGLTFLLRFLLHGLFHFLELRIDNVEGFKGGNLVTKGAWRIISDGKGICVTLGFIHAAFQNVEA